jgi:predicted nucleic-acid-binding Zn-ribbon protein
MSKLPKQCLHCGGSRLFTKRVAAGGNHGPNLLEGLGGFLRYARFDVVMCADCGRCEFFADEHAREKVANEWRQLSDAG